MIRPCDQFGPWAVGPDAAEQRARLRAMRALARVYCGPRGADFARLLAKAETDPAALESALAALDRLPSNDRRQILASYAALTRAAGETAMSNVVPFPRMQIEVRDRTSGMRVALLNGRWCIERLAEGRIIDRRFMPTQTDAERIARRIARRNKVMMLTACRSRPRPWPSFHRHTPDDAA